MRKSSLAVALCCFSLSLNAAYLNLTRIGEGAIQPDVGVHRYSQGQQVTLRATPEEGWVVDHWEGDVTGSGSTKTTSMSRSKRATVVFRPLAPTPANALARYVGELDSNYRWSLHDYDRHFGWNKHTIRMQSQQWRSTGEVDRALWTHDLNIVEPWFADNECALLINGGSNRSGPPVEVDSAFAAITLLYGICYAQVDQVPNEPLFFADERNHERSEDAILAYSLDKYLVTGDFRWPVHLAMAKAGVRAMDTIQKRLPFIRDFLVAGGSKRGWTAYLVAAVDPRVAALAAVSIDIPNFAANTRHHFEAYGFYAPAIQDYVDFDLFCRVNSPRGQELLQIIDPLSYFPQYTMPKLLINSAGDQFFLPDSSRFYYASLPGPKWLRYTVNTDHKQIQDLTTLTTVLQWADKALDAESLPRFTWSFEPDGSIRVQTFTRLRAVRLWQAHNPVARDFRLENIGPAWTSSSLSDQGGGVYVGFVPQPAQGWSAFLVELDFGEGIFLSTEVVVTPDTLPFAGQACR
ncbi:MAG TPA: PhoPQ-activated protein PqaA family protein [Verrucomicrobiae bacterium]|nr:PhoPQ-activated protein PqaA family protein [Verrucomicrobiae bacterium]